MLYIYMPVQPPHSSNPNQPERSLPGAAAPWNPRFPQPQPTFYITFQPQPNYSFKIFYY